MEDNEIIYLLVMAAMIITFVWIFILFISAVINEYRHLQYYRWFNKASDLAGIDENTFDGYVRLAHDLGYKDKYYQAYKLLEQDYINSNSNETED